MELLNDYFKLREELFEYFGYKEDRSVIPISGYTKYWWQLEGEGPGPEIVRFADTVKEFNDQEGNYYEEEIYTQRYLPKWVYRGKDYTMVCVDTQTDGNKFLSIFDNAKEVGGQVNGA